jgi:hypothetical protein
MAPAESSRRSLTGNRCRQFQLAGILPTGQLQVQLRRTEVVGLRAHLHSFLMHQSAPRQTTLVVVVVFRTIQDH